VTRDLAESGRIRQRRRTRAAIVNAAAGLLRDGSASPGINEIAEAADVSRRTIYQYFPTLDQLLLDATLGLLTQNDVDAAIDAAAGEHADVTQRVDAMIRVLGEMAASSLPLGRSLIRLTVDSPAEDPQQPKRGYRRIGWIERAIEPLRDALDDDLFEQLVSSLAMVVGWEALIVLQDLRGLDAERQVQTSTWAARALIRSAVDEQAARAAPRTKTSAGRTPARKPRPGGRPS
jgi:AcrR family transcriptional regulator